MEEKDMTKNNKAEDGIDLIEITASLWAKRWFIIKITAIFLLIGLFLAISAPNEFTASTTMVPQSGEKRASGSLSGLAAMAGINIGSMNSSEILSPSVYSQIFGNVNFQKDLLYSKFSFEKSGKPLTYFEYYTDNKYNSFNLLGFIKRYTLGLPSLILGTIYARPNKEAKKANLQDEIQQLTIEESRLIGALFSNLSLELKEKEGYITLSYTSEEPKLSAEIVQTAQKLLQNYITEFKLQKVKSNLMFVEASYQEAKNNFEKKQAELACYRDRNISLSSAMAKTQEEKLISEYNLLLSIYTELAKQREQAKISVTETTPILTVIKPVIIPNAKSGPNKTTMLIGFLFLGLVSAVGWVLGYPLVDELIKKIKRPINK